MMMQKYSTYRDFIISCSNGSRRAFNELGSHLDQIFRHLSYKTGGLKFTCIAGGRDPNTGEIVVVE
jgi:hypothetical protein